MRRSLPKKAILIFLTLCLLLGVMVGLFGAQMLSQMEHQRLARLLGYTLRTNPELETTLIHALKEATEEDYREGQALLATYHYNPQHLVQGQQWLLVGCGALAMVTLGAGFLLMGARIHQKRLDRIAGLTTYLEAMNQGKETLLHRQEDEFSQLEDELYKTVMEMRQAKEHALKEHQALADNLADISHQLKTPLTSMSLMTELLSAEATEAQRGYLERLSHQIQRLERLVSSLLTLSRLDAGTLEFKREPVDVYTMLTLAMAPIEEQILQKKQQVKIFPDTALTYWGDLSWSIEAFLNLLKNCSDHTPEGGEIIVHYGQNPLYTEIQLIDQGRGFDKGELPHLFRRFYKGKNAVQGSIGIGLALAKSIIEKQGGTLRAENAPEGGACFTVKFYRNGEGGALQ